MTSHCMQDSFARARTRPKGQARAQRYGILYTRRRNDFILIVFKDFKSLNQNF